MEDREEKLKDDLREMSKPLARYKDDEDLSMMQRNKFHEDDPMLLFGKDKLIEQGVIKIGTLFTIISSFPTRNIYFLKLENKRFSQKFNLFYFFSTITIV